LVKTRTTGKSSRPSEVAERLVASYSAYAAEFADVTARARARFAARDWRGMHADAVERLDLYGAHVDRTVALLRMHLREAAADQRLWRLVRRSYSACIAEGANAELMETFYNSVVRRLFDTDGVNEGVEYVAPNRSTARPPAAPAMTGYSAGPDWVATVRRILTSAALGAPFSQVGPDSRLAARVIASHLRSLPDAGAPASVEVLRAPFFRHKGGFLVGRITCRNSVVPLVFAVVNDEHGVRVDAVLTDQADISILFSFTRAYFHVEGDCPRDLIAFIRTLLPVKPVAELYIALGFHKHGKRELYRDLVSHLRNCRDAFEAARGDAGMVMLVFTLPGYDMVFKVIRDRFAPPKTTTRNQVRERYRLVFQHDRVGRLVDAQEFEHLAFRRAQFRPELLAELQAAAPSTVVEAGEMVVIRHLYTERKITPLNLFVREAPAQAAAAAVIDYGNAIKELAAANIFPGDFLLKNFGVTRHGRVVFYDYDELCLVTDCSFRTLPPARNFEDELDAEPWFGVAQGDVFPEEFERFLGLPDELRDVFVAHHGDLFTARFWRSMQERHRAGEILDAFPYAAGRRLPGRVAEDTPAASPE
jgi:isocitrate dehydrogenase kinase/phosphatase